MSKLEWDKTGERFYHVGVSKGVIYPYETSGYGKGVAWNGLTGVNENPSGAEATDLYADNSKYLALMSAEKFGFTIEAYTYPDEFAVCDGSASIGKGVTITMQKRKSFGFSYQTIVGNDTEGQAYGHQTHLVYGCLASPSSKEHGTINENPDASTMSWEVNSTPVPVEGHSPTSHLILDSTKMDAEKLTAIENILYGTVEAEPRLLLPDEIIAMLGD